MTAEPLDDGEANKVALTFEMALELVQLEKTDREIYIEYLFCRYLIDRPMADKLLKWLKEHPQK